MYKIKKVENFFRQGCDRKTIKNRIYGYEEIVEKFRDEIIEKADIPDNIKLILIETDIYVTGNSSGYAYDTYITVPKWSLTNVRAKKGEPKEWYFKYYIAHELSHIAASNIYNENVWHCSKFYDTFKKVCPPEIQYYELGYLKGAAKAGIKKLK